MDRSTFPSVAQTPNHHPHICRFLSNERWMLRQIISHTCKAPCAAVSPTAPTNFNIELACNPVSIARSNLELQIEIFLGGQ